jgi:poly(3-hydroxybutyrate) depolymerase
MIVPLALSAAVVVAASDLSKLDDLARAPATRVELAPAPDGSLGAWLVAGPYVSPSHTGKTSARPAIDETTLAPTLGPAWTLASSASGPIDLKAALHARENDVIGYAGGTLHVEAPGRYLLLVGADDGLVVSVDGQEVYRRDESRPQRDDDDMVTMDLRAGDHSLLLKLHQRDAGWAFKVRLLDDHLAPPTGAYLALPGTTPDDARALAAKLSWVSVDRALGAGPYHPKLTVRFPEGAPRGVPLRTALRLVRTRDRMSLLDLTPGEVPLDARGVGELVATLPVVGDRAEDAIDDSAWTYEVDVAGRTVKAAFLPKKPIHDAVARATRALAATEPDAPWLASGSRDSVAYLLGRLTSFGSHADGDIDAQLDEARELDQLSASLEKAQDPYAHRTGPMRRALEAPFDGKPSPFGLYVPPSYRPGGARRYPLIIGLHGLNGRPMAEIRYLFGFDDPAKENDWEDRHMVSPLPPLDAFVLAPNGYGNTMYRDLGEDDILRDLAWTLSRYPIDPDRVTITGMSMGGIGAASVPFRHPDLFAAAEPLCGYHSYFVRRDIAGHALRPWEKFLAEERSNVFWSWNGQHLPLYIVHGTLDQPEDNSGVLIKRYEELNYDVVHEHPPLGHNVWQTTYENLKGAQWLLTHQRTAHPTEVRFRTLRLRDGDDAWVHIEELAAPDAWGEVDATIRARGVFSVRTSGVSALRLERDPALMSPRGKVNVTIDGTLLSFGDDDPLVMHREPGEHPGPWVSGPSKHEGAYKHGTVTGPIRDALHEPLLFVYGASDPRETRANEEVARQWAAIRWGVTVEYPVMSDLEFLANNEPLANDRGLFLVGSARTNAVVRALDPKLPIHIDGYAVVIGKDRFTGRELGAAFIRPNPHRPDRYVVVVEGTTPLGTWRSLSLPDLIPDFVVYDESIAPARGQMIVGTGSVRAAGFFTNDWALPSTMNDPLAHSTRPAAKSEYEATPYLP